MATEQRPAIPCATQVAVWVAAAGRCTFCDSLVTGNEDLGEIVSIGEFMLTLANRHALKCYETGYTEGTAPMLSVNALWKNENRQGKVAHA